MDNTVWYSVSIFPDLSHTGSRAIHTHSHDLGVTSFGRWKETHIHTGRMPTSTDKLTQAQGRTGDIGAVRQTSFSDVCIHGQQLTLDGAPVDVLVLRFLQSRIFVKKVGHVGQVQLRISSHNISRCDKLTTAEAIGLFQHELCPFHVILFL